MAIGRPLSLTPNIATKAISVVATADQKDFTVTGGYRINELSVYKSGVRLAQGRDFTANDGSTVTLDTAAGAGNIVEFVVFDTFNVANSLVSAASSQTLNGDFNITGKLYAAEFSNADSLNIGVGTFASLLHVGSALTANASGDVETVGIITAASFSGSGANLTSLPVGTTITVADESSDTTCFPSFFTAATGNLAPKTGTNLTFNSSSGALTATSFVGALTGAVTGNADTSTTATNVTVADESSDTTCFPTFVTAATGNLPPKSGSNLTFNSSSGALTATSVNGNIVGGTVAGSTGTFSGAVNVDDTTDSTSSTSGALIVDGGLGVAKNVYIGAGLSVAGTLTYEDVTNVDSVGLITAKSGVNITGGQLLVGSGVTIGIAGVSTFSGTSDIHLLDSVRLNVGDASDLAIYHDGSHSFISDSGTGGIKVLASDVYIKNASDADMIHAQSGGAVKIYHNGNQKFETTNDGTSTTGIATATGLDVADKITHTGDVNTAIRFPANDNISFETAGSSRLKFESGGDISIYGTAAGVTSAYWDASANSLIFNDNSKAVFGDGSDLSIYHNGSHSWIDNNTGNLILQSDNQLLLKDANGSDTYLACTKDGSVDIYYDNSKKFETTNDGTVTTGICSATDFSGLAGGLADFPNGLTSSSTVKVNDSSEFIAGDGNDLRLWHNGTDSYIKNYVGDLNIQGDGDDINMRAADDITLLTNTSETAISCIGDGAVSLYYDNSVKIATTSIGVNVTGVGTFTQGLNLGGMLKEKCNITAGKLSANTTIDLEDGMIHYFSTDETTTGTPNIRWNSTYSLNNKMYTGEAVTVSLIYKPNAAGYFAALNVDGSGVTEEWSGGAAPSAANAGGYDVLTHTLVKTADATFICLSNVQNYA
jgi:hypothetical protein